MRITPARFGGSITISAGSQSRRLEGSFISGGVCTPGLPFFGFVPTNECVLNGAPSGCTSSWTYYDAGASISANSGSTTLTANRTVVGSQISYSFSSGSAAPQGVDYVVSAAGSTDIAAGSLATIHVPQKVTTASGSTYTPGQPWTLNMAGTEGADMVEIRLSNNVSSYTCDVSPGSSFTVPAEVTADFGSSSFNVTALSYTGAILALNGRDILLLGIGN